MREISFNYVIVRNGADYGRLWPAQDSTPTIRMDESGEIKTSLSGEFLPTVFGFDGKPIEDAEINWLSDCIRPEIVIDGTSYSLGVYLPATVETNIGQSGTDLVSYSVEAYDRCWQVQTAIQTQVYFASGTTYLSAIESLLTSAGIALISKEDIATTFQEDRADWSVGTDSLTIINQLLSEINYNPLWFDGNGVARLEAATTPSADNIDHYLDASDPDTLVRAGIRKTMDIYSAPNVFLCICNNADKSAIMTATSENTNPQSPLSIARRGRRIVQVENVDNIASQADLQAYADRLRNESMITGETIEVQTGLLTGFGVKDVTAISIGDTFEICAERAWSMQLAVGGGMSHTLEKVVINIA